MTIYRFDWKDIIYGRVEIEASSGQEANDKLMGMRIKDLLHISQFNSDNKERSIRFADAGNHVENMDSDEWNKLKMDL